ncbi:hypothetical protein ACJMK2_008200 [Sinanodonta woodiana]|uniref:c-SKI SMAD4-binding domain-containing protein n=1 Tax=Sinanodonta woodiana TaxID=1069815 RepID=A0ABD3VKV2_SINWO
MEVVPQSISPHLKRVLKSYQTEATRSMQGPGVGRSGLLPGMLTSSDIAKLNSTEEYRKALVLKSDKGVDCDPFRAPPPFPVQQMPVFTPVDCSRSEKTETILEGEGIACFVVGGEKRLCLPQILNTVLRDFTLQQINSVCDELHIFCSRCNPEQLETLKVTGILPLSAPSCGLITKTDAERLCNALLHRSPEKSNTLPSHNSFKVYHECFGKCKGIFCPDEYTSALARCIKCVDCGGWFSPQKYVCHSHKALENRTCHWGFDSANWRSYLLLAKDQGGKEKIQEVLEQVKARFDTGNKYKRKQQIPESDSDLSKRTKSSEDRSGSSSSPSSWAAEQGSPSSLRAIMSASAFQTWPSITSTLKEGKLLPAPPAIMREGFPGIRPPYLHTGPPVLLHPDKVVPHSESARYEPNYAPNVSLAPAPHRKPECNDDGDDDDESSTVNSRIMEKNGHRESGMREVTNDHEWFTESDDSSTDYVSSPDGEGSSSSYIMRSSAIEEELGMIRRALDGKVGSSKELKDKFLQEFSRIRLRHDEQLSEKIREKHRLKQGCEAPSSELVQEYQEKNRKLKKEIARICVEAETRIQEVQEDKEKLVKDVKAIHDMETSKLIQMNRDLQKQLQQFEIAYEQIRVENILMSEKLHQLGINILDLLSKPSFNGNHVKSPPRSPPRSSAVETMSSARQRGSASSHHSSTKESSTSVKKERDT